MPTPKVIVVSAVSADQPEIPARNSEVMVDSASERSNEYVWGLCNDYPGAAEIPFQSGHPLHVAWSTQIRKLDHRWISPRQEAGF